MQAGRESQTAVMVAMGRAAAHGVTTVRRFSDPTAVALLPEEARQRVLRFRAGETPRGLRGRLAHYRTQMMVARTVAIDDAIREAGARQLVILGAGLDGRAWRMPELADTTVWEVDHPDSQAQKRSRITRLTQAAREVRFVPVDFTRDTLGDALAAAGHDPAAPTTWVWEGVVMYLTRAEVDATLAAVAARSAPGSHLVILYHCPAPLLLGLIGLLVRRLGEPLRSSFTQREMAAVLDFHGFDVLRDQGLPEIGAALGGEVAAATGGMKHMRIVTAARRADGRGMNSSPAAALEQQPEQRPQQAAQRVEQAQGQADGRDDDQAEALRRDVQRELRPGLDLRPAGRVGVRQSRLLEFSGGIRHACLLRPGRQRRPGTTGRAPGRTRRSAAVAGGTSYKSNRPETGRS
jgi:methyltransferase (TIGR00027 family)